MNLRFPEFLMTRLPQIKDIDPLELTSARPEWSANVPLTRSQQAVMLLGLIALILAGWRWPTLTGRVLIAAATCFYLFLTVYKLLIIGASIKLGAWFRFSAEEIKSQEPRDWPVYSIIVPMYKEPEVVPQMVRAMHALDYPADRLDVQFLLEEDDDATVDAMRAQNLPPNFRITLIPPSHPRTKPKACNIGLALARGEYLVIYDAEDRPEPDQIKKAVMAFEESPPEIVCVQSCLNFYNSRDNLLTRFFTAEYSAWYDLQLPGLSALRSVIPLGGTSNHFRIEILRELYGWDAWNVTEDCDLGVRLCRAGYHTAMLDTTTWEEACRSLPFWIRQRTRWIKGYLQTWFVHMRNPWRLWRELGTVNFLHFQALIGGVFVSFLLNPIFWFMTLIWFVLRPLGLDHLFPGVLFAMSIFCLFVGNFLFLYINLLGCYRRNYDRLLLANLLTPFYWMLMSVSGWRAFIQFFTNPFLWEKTQHALGKKRRRKGAG